MEVLRKCMTHIEITDVLPSSMPQTSIQSTHIFFKHLILPFVSVT